MALGPNNIGKKQAGTGYQNIRRLIGANQQQSQLGQNIANKLQQRQQGVQQQIEGEKAKFQEGLSQAGNLQERETKAQQAIQRASQGGAGEQDVQQFKQATAAYQGPTGLSGNVSNTANRAMQMGKSNLGQLLQQQVKRQGYNPNLRRFDEVLLQRDPAAQDIRQKQAALRKLGSQYQESQSAAQGQALLMQAEIKDLNQRLNKGITDTSQGITSTADEALKTKQAESQNKIDRIKSILNNPNAVASQEDLQVLQELGITPNSDIYDLSREQLLQQINPTYDQMTRQNVMTQQQASALKQLGQLQGKNITDAELGITDPSQLGQFRLGQANLLPTLEAKRADIQSRTQPLIEQMNKYKEANYGKAANIRQYQNTLSEMSKYQDSMNKYNQLAQQLDAELGPGYSTSSNGASHISQLLPRDVLNDVNQYKNLSGSLRELQNTSGIKPAILKSWTEVGGGDQPTIYHDTYETDQEALDRYTKGINTGYNDIYKQYEEAMRPYVNTKGQYRNIADLLGIDRGDKNTMNPLTEQQWDISKVPENTDPKQGGYVPYVPPGIQFKGK